MKHPMKILRLGWNTMKVLLPSSPSVHAVLRQVHSSPRHMTLGSELRIIEMRGDNAIPTCLALRTEDLSLDNICRIINVRLLSATSNLH